MSNETDNERHGSDEEVTGLEATQPQEIPEIQRCLERLVADERQTKQWVNDLIEKTKPIDASFLRHLASCVGNAKAFLKQASPSFSLLEGTIFEDSAVHVVFYRLGVPILGDSHEHASFFTQWKKSGQISVELSSGFASEMMLSDPGSVRVASWMQPFDAMRIVLPNPACPILLETKKGEQRAKYITVHRSRRSLPGVPVFGVRTEYMTGANDFMSFVAEIGTYTEAAVGALEQYTKYTEETLVIGVHTGFGYSLWSEIAWVDGALVAEQASIASIGSKMLSGEGSSDGLEGVSEERATNDVALSAAHRIVANTLLSFGTKEGSPSAWGRAGDGAVIRRSAVTSAEIVRIASGLSSGQNPIEVTRAMVSAGSYIGQDNELVPVVFRRPESLGTSALASETSPGSN